MTSLLGDMEAIMNKEEILEKSRQENKGKDIYELSAVEQAMKIGILVAAIVGLVIMLFAMLWDDKSGYYSTMAIFFSITGTIHIVKYVKIRKKHEAVIGIGYALVAAGYFAIYIINLVK